MRSAQGHKQLRRSADRPPLANAAVIAGYGSIGGMPDEHEESATLRAAVTAKFMLHIGLALRDASHFPAARARGREVPFAELVLRLRQDLAELRYHAATIADKLGTSIPQR